MENKSLKNSPLLTDIVPLGTLYGLLAPGLVFFAIYLYSGSDRTLGAFTDELFRSDVADAMVALCTVANLAVFFGFLTLEKYLAARGVILATILLAGFMLYLKAG